MNDPEEIKKFEPPANIPPADQSRGIGWLHYVQTVASSILLLLVYLLVFAVVFMCLSAHEMQTRISSTIIDDRPANIYDVLRPTQEIDAARYALSVFQRARDRVGFRINELNAERILAKNERDKPAIEAWKFFPRLGLEFTNDIRQNPALGMPAFTELKGTITNPGTLLFTPKMNEIVERFNRTHGEVIRINREKDRQNELRVQLDKSISERKLKLNSSIIKSLPHLRAELEFFLMDKHSSWRSDLLRFLGFVSRFEGATVTVVKADGTTIDVVRPPREYVFIGLPPALLMILIAVVAGALGGLIRVTESYLSGTKDPDEAVWFYIARPLFGMLAALTVFVLLKSGILLVTGGAAGGSEGSPVNAYFVAFASIVSGLMSESAIDTLRTAGKGLLSRNAITDTSYASGVVNKMQDQGKTVDELYAYFIDPQKTVDGWLSEQERVPAYARQTISAWLNGSTRELFTDLRANEPVFVEKA